jgi:hypothetical protein
MSRVVFLRSRGADHDTVDPAGPGYRGRRFDRQLRLLPTFCAGAPRAAQLPHDGDVVGELAPEPRGRDEQFRAPGPLAKEACRFREIGGRKWFGEVAD